MAGADDATAAVDATPDVAEGPPPPWAEWTRLRLFLAVAWLAATAAGGAFLFYLAAFSAITLFGDLPDAEDYRSAAILQSFSALVLPLGPAVIWWFRRDRRWAIAAVALFVAMSVFALRYWAASA